MTEREVIDSIRSTLKSKGVDENHFRIKAKTKMTSAKIPLKTQDVKESKEVVEYPKTVITMVKMKFSVEFVLPNGESTLP